MKKIKVGYVRLYNAKGCSVIGGEEFAMKFIIGETEVIATIGPKFRHVIMTSKLKVLNKDRNINTRAREFESPSPQIFPADVYTEITATRELQVDDSLAEAFLKQDIKARNEIFKMAEQSKHLFTNALDYMSGILGICFHPQSINTPIAEQLWAYRGIDTPSSTQSVFKIKNIPSYSLDVSENSRDEIMKLVPKISKNYTFEKVSEVLGWMLRAWQTNDTILKFISLFTALECVIPKMENEDSKNFESTKNKLIVLVEKNSNISEKKFLLEFLKELKVPNIPLTTRFENWASGINFTGWKCDLKAFKRFNRMRNLLLHQGKSDVEFKVEIENDVEVKIKDISTLEDIVHRYVNLALFES